MWILGDISWYNATKTVAVFNELNGIKHLCVGNHDKKLLRNREVQNLFTEIVDYKEIQTDSDSGIVLSHYPIPCFNHHYYGWYHLYGHVHNSWEWNIMKQVKYQMEELYKVPCNMFNIGCMIPGIDYTPRTLEEIIQMNKEEER